jgi:hypothetical protein
MTGWYFLTLYYYTLVVGPFASQQQCDAMRQWSYSNSYSTVRISTCYEAPLAQIAPSPPLECLPKTGCR